ncbi:hypothetical protein AAF712_006323 [Marasmius tenuissimus]|uniref:Uncharacterized protein n=1 Tax=Marasmius tenuissimus TaxID=585030 RepID=A0ABR2ZZB4_9AGAR
MSEFFSRARDFEISGGNFSHVGGNQHNHYNQTTIVTAARNQRKRYITGTEDEEAEYAEYHEVWRADIIKLADIHHDAYATEDQKRKIELGLTEDIEADKTICKAVMRGQEMAKVTVVSYSGREADKAWRQDFIAHSTYQ